MPTDVNVDTRVTANANRLLRIDKSIRSNVADVIAVMESYGFLPLIHSNVWRSPETQFAMFKRGVTKVTWGFHCASVNANGVPLTRRSKEKAYPGSLAADIVDANLLWSASREFWLTLGYAARTHGLMWGGHFFSTKTHAKEEIDRFNARLLECFDMVQRHQAIPKNEKIVLGWDVAHVQTARVTISQAANGLR